MNGGARLLSRGLGRLADVKIAGVEIVSVLVLGVLPFALGVLLGQRSEVMEGLVDLGRATSFSEGRSKETEMHRRPTELGKVAGPGGAAAELQGKPFKLLCWAGGSSWRGRAGAELRFTAIGHQQLVVLEGACKSGWFFKEQAERTGDGADL
eukprot:CAMPEP_0182904680 /NCGR_PEP_ID=MMETSP0034_2-20130328/32294_1 /TAXON_ID=156128 /ORGANISM="Nephroselmis pyriformis, Strain CCMP717" /LENGTH=151 /DNA_ID=CAMNT_0025039883 /DNA_START=344 /DNA_END=798 /DNA_ORIENTATION=-